MIRSWRMRSPELYVSTDALLEVRRQADGWWLVVRPCPPQIERLPGQRDRVRGPFAGPNAAMEAA